MVEETPKPGDPIFIGSRIEIIGSIELALEEAQKCAARQGYESEVLYAFDQRRSENSGRATGSISQRKISPAASLATNPAAGLPAVRLQSP